MLNFNSLLIFSEDPSSLTDFYQKILDKKPDWSGGDFRGFKVGSGYITIGPHSEVAGSNMDPERIMFNLETEDVQKEFDRIKGLGAEVVTAPYQPEESPEGWVATLADPDGNYFQLVSPMDIN